MTGVNFCHEHATFDPWWSFSCICLWKCLVGCRRNDHYCARNHIDLNFDDDIKHYFNDEHNNFGAGSDIG
jgi:hypothetical protein